MNNKGFTLVEMLAVVVILGIVMGIATNGVINYINTSKKKSEDVFISKLESAIVAYIDLNKASINDGGITGIDFKKCKKSGDDSSDNCSQSSALEIGKFRVNQVVDKGLISGDKIINPKNKKSCFSNDKNPYVRVFKDSDYVYYYYVDLTGSNTLCDISSDNSVITNFPSKLCSSIKNIDTSINC